MKPFVCIAIELTLSCSAAGAAAPYVQGQLIVRFIANQQAAAVLRGLGENYKIKQPLVESLNLHLIDLPAGESVEAGLANLKRSSAVVYAQPDHLVSLRETVPDDPQFSSQWSLLNASNPPADISAPSAWDYGTGGKDRDGNDLVVAIVDGGMDVNHRDLVGNVWRNIGEVPDNGLDDDGNGYKDDVFGWNAFNNNGKVPSNQHGTHVAGIAGAVGGNGTDIAGVNWKVKLMAVAASSGTTSVIAAGYGYVLSQKRLWLSSNGSKGANVVATNSSFGVDFAKCESGEYPVWNDLYENMGKVGILSAVATANQNIDVDQKGDVPSGCSSQFLVKVTNTTNKDGRNQSAAFGKKTIELGAPGTNIVSTVPGNTTMPMTGTSMATPHVAGAIAFLHSVASLDFQRATKANPYRGAQILKLLMLANVDPIAALNGITVTGGRLNLAKAANSISQFIDFLVPAP